MIVEKKNLACESNAGSVARVYIVGKRGSRGSYFCGESVLYTTVFTRFTVI